MPAYVEPPPTCYCDHKESDHYKDDERKCKKFECGYGWNACQGFRLARCPKKVAFKVVGYSLQGNVRHVSVDKSTIQGKPYISVNLNSPGHSSVKGLMAAIEPDDARALADALVAMAKEVEGIDTSKTKDKYKRAQESK